VLKTCAKQISKRVFYRIHCIYRVEGLSGSEAESKDNSKKKKLLVFDLKKPVVLSELRTLEMLH